MKWFKGPWIQCKEHRVLNFMRLMAYWVPWIHACFVAMFVFRFIFKMVLLLLCKSLIGFGKLNLCFMVWRIYTLNYKTLDSIILVLGLFSSIVDVSYTWAWKKYSHYNISLCVRNKIDLWLMLITLLSTITIRPGQIS